MAWKVKWLFVGGVLQGVYWFGGDVCLYVHGQRAGAQGTGRARALREGSNPFICQLKHGVFVLREKIQLPRKLRLGGWAGWGELIRVTGRGSSLGEVERRRAEELRGECCNGAVEGTIEGLHSAASGTRTTTVCPNVAGVLSGLTGIGVVRGGGTDGLGSGLTVCVGGLTWCGGLTLLRAALELGFLIQSFIH